MHQAVNRRIFIGGSVATIAVLAISGCQNATNDILAVEHDGLFFKADELTILSDVAEIMIPKTDTAGAIDAEVPAVLDGMMMTWAKPSTQTQFREALKHFNALATNNYKSEYIKLSHKDRYALVEALDANAFSKPPVTTSSSAKQIASYKRLKDLIFALYYSSEKGIRDFVPIPGFYSGNLTLEEYENHIGELAYD